VARASYPRTRSAARPCDSWLAQMFTRPWCGGTSWPRRSAS